MASKQEDLIPLVVHRPLRHLARAVRSAQAQLAAAHSTLPPVPPEDNAAPEWREDLDVLVLERLPALASLLEPTALGAVVDGAVGEVATAPAADPLDPLRRAVVHVLPVDVREALRQVVGWMLGLAHEARAAETPSPPLRGEVRGMIADLRHLAATLARVEAEGADTGAPEERHLVAAARPARRQVEAALERLVAALTTEVTVGREA